MAEQVDHAGNVEYPVGARCEWDVDNGEPCPQRAAARVVVGGVGFDVCEQHRRQLVGDGLTDR